MSWVEKIETPCRIITGDGSIYQPLWKPTSKGVEYNISEYNFPDVPGTKVEKREPKGVRYNGLFYFQGEDHLDVSKSFEESSKDHRPWTMSHPFFGDVTVHPISMNFDQSALNVTTITCVLVETLTDDFPQAEVIPADEIQERNDQLVEDGATSFEDNVEVTSNDLLNLSSNNQLIYTEAVKNAPTSAVAEEYFNLFTAANRKITNGLSDVNAAITGLSAVINAPSLFETTVFSRLKAVQNNMNTLISQLGDEPGINSKRVFENNATILMGSMTLAAVNPLDSDYVNAMDVFRAIDLIGSVYDLYIDTLNSIQSLNGYDPNSYVPDPTIIQDVSEMVGYTISNLFDLSLTAKQQRNIVLEADTNPILLTHRLYGLDQDDANINRLINENDIGLNEMYLIKKNRNIVYYV